jgi:hypothetical protein
MWKMWPDKTCAHCGHVEKEEDGLYYLECPGCEREGCDECMPMGRGCLCPECEDRCCFDSTEDDDEEE